MKETTLKQAGKVLELIAQKKTPREQLQKLLSSGLFSDLLDANIDSVNRDAFRKSIGLDPFIGNNVTITSYTVLVNYDCSVEDSIKAGKYDWKNHNIMSKHFPSQETGTAKVMIELFNFNMRL